MIARFLDSAVIKLGDCTGMGLIDWYVLPHSGRFPFVEAAAKTIGPYGDELDT